MTSPPWVCSYVKTECCTDRNPQFVKWTFVFSSSTRSFFSSGLVPVSTRVPLLRLLLLNLIFSVFWLKQGSFTALTNPFSSTKIFLKSPGFLLSYLICSMQHVRGKKVLDDLAEKNLQTLLCGYSSNFLSFWASYSLPMNVLTAK